MGRPRDKCHQQRASRGRGLRRDPECCRVRAPSRATIHGQSRGSAHARGRLICRRRCRRRRRHLPRRRRCSLHGVNGCLPGYEAGRLDCPLDALVSRGSQPGAAHRPCSAHGQASHPRRHRRAARRVAGRAAGRTSTSATRGSTDTGCRCAASRAWRATAHDCRVGGGSLESRRRGGVGDDSGVNVTGGGYAALRGHAPWGSEGR